MGNNLIVDEKDFHSTILEDLLPEYVTITSGGTVHFKGTGISQKMKILVYTACNKLMKMKSIKENEAETPKQISVSTGIPEGTVKRTLRELEREKILNKTENSEYFLPNHFLQKLNEYLRGLK